MTQRLAGPWPGKMQTSDEGERIWVEASGLDYWMEERLAGESTVHASPYSALESMLNANATTS